MKNNLWEQEHARSQQAEWDRVAGPIAQAMVELRTLYCTPRMIIGANGTTTEFAEAWENPAAEELFKSYQRTLEILRARIFGA